MLMKLPLPVMTREPATQQDVIEVTDMDVALTPPPKGSSGTIPGFGEFAALPAPVRASGDSRFTPSGVSNELDTIPISILTDFVRPTTMLGIGNRWRCWGLRWNW